MKLSALVRMSNVSDFVNVAKKIVCVGRNYADHATELNNPVPKKPILFVKTTNSFIKEGQKIRFPPGCNDLHHEVELGVVIGKKASKVSKKDALDYVAGYTVALDMTARDIQDELKGKGHPWFLAKSFDTSCAVSGFVEKSRVPNPHDLELVCAVNGVEKQHAKTDQMIFDIPTLIEFTTASVTLEPGDLLLTGTPSGVGPCKHGDKIDFRLSDLLKATFEVE